MNVLITGISGMVGSHLADYLLKNTDWKIYGLFRWNEPLDNLEHLVDRINNKEIHHINNLQIVCYNCNSLKSNRDKPNNIKYLP